jgi:hypothetical protein
MLLPMILWDTQWAPDYFKKSFALPSLIITELYYKSCRVDPRHWQSSNPERRRGIYPATNDQFVKLTPLALTGTDASRKKTPGVG